METGTRESRREIRTWMRNLSEFVQSVDIIHSRPLPDWVESLPDHVLAATLAVSDKEYIAYLADAREATDAAAGQPIGGRVFFNLPDGAFQVSLYSPTSGEYSPAVALKGGRRASLELLPFQEDMVIRATREKAP